MHPKISARFARNQYYAYLFSGHPCVEPINSGQLMHVHVINNKLKTAANSLMKKVVNHAGQQPIANYGTSLFC